jgi:DNA-binding transcriptional LysR family regulator
MEIELRHLRYFSAVAEELHFGRAAERLHIAQPSLSQQIRKLERAIGAELFDRSARSISLTPAGSALFEHTHRIFAEVDSAVTASRDAAKGTIGRLSVGFVEAAAISIVPAATRKFGISHPRVTLELRELAVPAQVEQLARGTLDIGFLRTGHGSDDLVVERTIEERFVAALPSNHPLAGRRKIAPSKVVDEPLVMVDRRVLPGLYDETIALIRDHGGHLNISQQATSILAILGLVSAGLGIALLPASVEGLAFTEVSYVPLDPSPNTTILAVRHRDNDSPQIAPFLAAIA